MYKKLISVVVPVYNGAKTLKRCIESIKNQTYENIEIIIVDDGSEDGSAGLAEELAACCESITAVQIKHGGVSAARNAAIEYARGEYITFMDCDDTADENMLSVMARELDDGAQLAAVGIERINGREKLFEPYDEKEVVYIKNAVRLYLKPMYFNSCANKLYITRVIKSNNIRFCDGVHIGEDFLFNAEYARYAEKTAVISKPMYRYEMSGATAMPFSDIRRFDIIAQMYTAIIPYAEGDDELAECVKRKICEEYMFAVRLFCASEAGFAKKVRALKKVLKSAEYKAVRSAAVPEGMYGRAVRTGSAFVICLYFYIGHTVRRRKTE